MKERYHLHLLRRKSSETRSELVRETSTAARISKRLLTMLIRHMYQMCALMTLISFLQMIPQTI